MFLSFMDGQESIQSLKGTPLLGQVFKIQLEKAERIYKNEAKDDGGSQRHLDLMSVGCRCLICS